MAKRDARLEHLLRRAGLGGSEAELEYYSALGYTGALDELLNYERVPDEVDSYIGQPGYIGITTRGRFMPNSVIGDARQRWLFRMLHAAGRLQEKMTLFWHNHFATAYSKIAGAIGAEERHAAHGGEGVRGSRQRPGQIELFRDSALGNFRDLLVAVAKDIRDAHLARRQYQHGPGRRRTSAAS